MHLAIELMCPGVPVTAWASRLPRASNTHADRSPASATGGENDVRTRAAACSFTIAMSRLQNTSRVSGSRPLVRSVIHDPILPEADHEIQTRIDLNLGAGPDDD